MNRMNKTSHRQTLCFALLLGLLLALLALNLISGSTAIPLSALPQALLGHGETASARIVRDIRLPRLLAAALLGGALSVAGFQLQSLFANPIAGPFVLGISSGAKLCVALCMILCLANGVQPGSFTLVLAASLGALLSMALVLLASSRLHSASLLIVCGVMIGYICSAVTDLVVTFADDANIVNLHNWSLGSFSGISWKQLGAAAVVVLLGFALSLPLCKPMEAYRLGESYARSMGVNLRRFRLKLILLASLLAACVTAFAGPISFVGIAVPHLMKSLFRSAKPLLMLPACFLGGSVFCLLCDLLARVAFAPTELSISSVTAVFGAPVVLWMLLSRHARREL